MILLRKKSSSSSSVGCWWCYCRNIISNIFGEKGLKKEGKTEANSEKGKKTKKNQPEIRLFTSTIQMVRKFAPLLDPDSSPKKEKP